MSYHFDDGNSLQCTDSFVELLNIRKKLPGYGGSVIFITNVESFIYVHISFS